MKRAISLGCALLAGTLAACQQTLVLDDLALDAGLSGSGGVSGSGGTSGGKGSGGPTDASADGRCFGTIQYEADVPQVIVALDRSTGATMTDSAFGASEFLTAAADLSTIVSRYEGPTGPGHNGSSVAVSFYYLAFPGSVDTNTCNVEMGCCATDVTYTPDSQDFQNAAYACNMSGGDCPSSNRRPIAEALSTAGAYFSQSYVPQSGPRFVLLVTGGSPPYASDCFMPTDCQSAINAVDGLKNQSVTTYIVGLGDQGNIDCLQAMANDEGSSQYYGGAPTSGDVNGALQTVTTPIAQAACHGTLLTTVVGTNQLMVTYQGTPVNQDFKNGWTLGTDTGAPRLFLHGSACAMYVQNPFGLQIGNGCVPDRFGQNP